MILIRDAINIDKKDYSNLVMISVDQYFPFLFSEKIPSMLEKLFLKDNSFFSHKLAKVALCDEKIAGCMVTFSYSGKIKYKTKNAVNIMFLLGFSFFKRLKRILKCTSVIGEFNKNEFYISNLAVYPEYRNKGIGTALLKKAEEIALENDAGKIVLDVETNKTDAVKLYLKNDYVIESEIKFDFKNKFFNFYRMEKSL
jgi:ribosomal protein S18 acetylase RimI-like enzyme